MNKAILIGNLTADPEVKTTTTGIPVATFTLAVGRNFTNQSGEREADFIRCVSFRKQAEVIGQYLSKGSKVAVEGRIQTGSYDAPDGTKRYTTDIICENVEFLTPRSQQQDSGYGMNQNYGGNQSGNYNQNQFQQNRNQGYNHNNYNNNNNMNQQPQQQNQNDFFDNNSDIDISEDDLPF